MKKNIFLLILIFLLSALSINAEVYVSDLDKIKLIEFEGYGKAGKSNIKALKQSDSYEEAKKNAQAELGNYIKSIKNADNITLEELSQSSLSMQKAFSDTVKESKVISKEWDENDNAKVKVQLDLLKLKDKLNKLGVK